MTVSKSPERNTFQKEAYIERCKKEGKEPNAAYLKMYDDWNKLGDKWAEEEHSNDLEYDLRTTDWILEKARSRDGYAQNIYAALCNNGFIKLDVIPILKEQEWSCSWRYAGGIVAELRNQDEDYLDFYCSGGEGIVQDDIAEDFARIGWHYSEWPKDK